MNFYDTDIYHKIVKEISSKEKQLTRKVFLDEDYSIKYYIANTEDSYEVCELYQTDTKIFEWINIYGKSRFATMINHRDGNKYLLFDEDLYGYSVLNLSTLKSIHYIPLESHLNNKEFRETFIWCKPHYNIYNNLLAVDGYYWASPNSIILLDFSNPMKIVPTSNWIEVNQKYNQGYEIFDDITFKEWNYDKLICNAKGENNSILIIDTNNRNV